MLAPSTLNLEMRSNLRLKLRHIMAQDVQELAPLGEN